MTSARNHSKRGTALLEFALGWALLWSLFAGVYQFGYSFYIYNIVITSVANAAELGSRMDYDTGNPSPFTAALTNMVVYGNTTAGTIPLVPGLSSANVNVNANLVSSIPTNITVNISNFTIDAFFTKFMLNGKPSATTPYMGQIVCASC
jgi:hypothetical protein